MTVLSVNGATNYVALFRTLAFVLRLASRAATVTLSHFTPSAPCH